MKSSRRTRWRTTVRVLAVMFLLLACADLAFPQVCAEDNDPMFQTEAAAVATFGHVDKSGEPQPHRAQTEDCFCCCSHILSSESGSPLAELTLVSASDPIVAPSVALAPLQILFHPPRLA
ncbi:MAG TPA: hypothetical protein VGQ76_19375 [Thermoanaerobaculia bacterium]|nr:hypothetical protein [Thermoanaerobaculia bacterium]